MEEAGDVGGGGGGGWHVVRVLEDEGGGGGEGRENGVAGSVVLCPRL